MSKQKILVIIQARLNSTRLPNKIMLPVSDDNKLTLIEYMLLRLQKALDIPVIIGIVLTLSSLFILINLLVDFIYAKLDPQVKLQ